MSVYWVQQEKVTKAIPEHDDIVLYGDIYSQSDILATTGCDGFLNVSKLNIDQDEAELVKSEKICSKISLDSTQKLQVSWNPVKELLATTVDKYLNSSSDAHTSPISFILWLSENILLTCDTLSNTKIWKHDTLECIYTLNHPKELKNIKFSKKQNLLVFLNIDGEIHTLNKNFESDQLLMSAERNLENIDIDGEVNKFEPEYNFKDVEMEESKERPSKTKLHNLDQQFERIQSDMDQLIGARPQISMMPGSVNDPEDPSYKLLCWNSVGSIAIRDEMTVKCVDIDFANRTFHKNLIVHDDINTKIATLGYNGAFLASEAKEEDLDQYEDDTKLADKNQLSKLKFVPFSSWNSIKTWSYELPKGESVE